MSKFAIKVPGNEDLITIDAEDATYDEYNLELTVGDRVVAYFKDWSYVYELPSPDEEADEEDPGDVVRSALDSR